MTKLDQFESTFRAAAKEVFAFEPPALTRISVVTDMNAENTAALTAEIRDFLRVLDRGDPAWTTIPGDGFDSVAALLEAVETARPDLIVTYRHLIRMPGAGPSVSVSISTCWPRRRRPRS